MCLYRLPLSSYSQGYEEINRFLHTDFCGLIRNVIDTNEQTLNVTVDESFKDFLSKFYTEAISGMLIDWIKNRVTQDREAVIQNMLLICRVSIPEILKAKAERTK